MKASRYSESIALEEWMYAMQQKNLVYNSTFMLYSNQVLGSNQMITYNTPDGWVYSDQNTGGSIGFNVANNSCTITKSPATTALMQFSQALHEFPRWKTVLRGKMVTAAAVIAVQSGTTNQMTICLNDGINTSSRSVLLVPGVKTLLDIDLKVADEATGLTVSLQSTSPGAVFEIFDVYANVGTIALSSLPPMVQGIIGERRQYVATETAPATELSVCETSVELSSEYTRLNSVLNGLFGTGTNGRSMLPDMRGYFSRSWSNGSGIDKDASTRKPLGTGTVSGDHVGTSEPDAFMQHSHQLSFSASGTVAPGTSVAVPDITLSSKDSTQPTGGNETRGINIAELYTIKWA